MPPTLKKKRFIVSSQGVPTNIGVGDLAGVASKDYWIYLVAITEELYQFSLALTFV